MLTEREAKEHREKSKRDRERKRLMLGDLYEDQGESEDDKVEEEDSDEETDSEYDSENQSEQQDVLGVTDLISPLGAASTMSRRRKRIDSRISDEIQHRFNALRFLALNLKSQNETLKPETAFKGGETPPSHQKGIGNGLGATF